MSNISRLESVLWEVYGKVKVMAEKINTTTPFLSRIEKSSNHVWGKEIRVGELPLRSELKNLYTKMQFSDKALRSAHGNELVRLISDEAEAAIKEASFNLQRQLLGDSSGRIRSTAELYGGMRIDVFSEKAQIMNGAVLEIDRKSNVAKLSNGRTLDFSKPASWKAYASGAKGRELTGLAKILSNSEELYERKRADQPVLRAKIFDKVHGEFTTAELNGILGELESDGARTDMIMVSTDVKYAYQNYLASNRLQMDTIELTDGFKAMSFYGIPMVADRIMPKGTIYALDTSTFTLQQLCDWRWLEYENGKILRGNDNGTYTAVLVKYCDLICTEPCKNARISGIEKWV